MLERIWTSDNLLIRYGGSAAVFFIPLYFLHNWGFKPAALIAYVALALFLLRNSGRFQIVRG